VWGLTDDREWFFLGGGLASLQGNNTKRRGFPSKDLEVLGRKNKNWESKGGGPNQKTTQHYLGNAQDTVASGREWGRKKGGRGKQKVLPALSIQVEEEKVVNKAQHHGQNGNLKQKLRTWEPREVLKVDEGQVKRWGKEKTSYCVPK